MRKPFKRILILVAAAAAVLLIAAFVYLYIPAPSEEGVSHLQLSRLPAPEYSLFSYSNPFFRPEERRPGELVDLPTGLEADGLTFFRLPLGNEEVFATIRQARGGWGELWVDTNLDRRLSDEEKIIGMNREGRYDFGTVLVGSQAAVDITSYDTEILLCRPAEFYIGKIRLDGSTYYIAAVDGDYDGRLSTPFASCENSRNLGCDIIAIDWNHTGRFFRYDFDSWQEVTPLGRYVKADERFYSVEAADDGRTLRLAPAQPEMGTLKIGPGQALSTFLLSDAVSAYFTVPGQVQLPAGRYQMESGSLDCTADTGEEYAFYAAFQADNGQFEIRPNETTTLTYGPPFEVRVETINLEDRTIGFNPTLKGVGGEQYSLLFNRKNAYARRKEPVLSILDESGQVVESGKMEFG